MKSNKRKSVRISVEQEVDQKEPSVKSNGSDQKKLVVNNHKKRKVEEDFELFAKKTNRIDTNFQFVAYIKNRPLWFLWKPKPKIQKPHFPKRKVVSALPREGSLEFTFLQQILKQSKDSGMEEDDEKDVSILLEGTPRSFELLRNTAINSFSPSQRVTNKQLLQKIQEIKTRESEHIQVTNMQKALQQHFTSRNGKMPAIELFGADDDLEEDDEDFFDTDEEDENDEDLFSDEEN